MAWFKSMTLFRLVRPALPLTLVNENLFVPCGALEIESRGWVGIVDGNGLMYTVNSQLFMRMATERKNLPKQVIDGVVRKRCNEIEEQQGFTPGRKQTREIREDVIDELLPRAFSTLSTVDVWIDPANGWIVVGSASPSTVDSVVSLLIKTFDKLPIETLRTAISPTSAMTSWLHNDEAPPGFTVDQDTELRSSGEGKATVRYLRHTLEAAEMDRHISAGKQCTRLAMTWKDRISFVLTEGLRIKSIVPLGVLKSDDEQSLAGDLMLMTGEFNGLLRDIVVALGGELEEVDA